MNHIRSLNRHAKAAIDAIDLSQAGLSKKNGNLTELVMQGQAIVKHLDCILGAIFLGQLERHFVRFGLHLCTLQDAK